MGRLKTALRWKGDAARRQRIQMVLLRESGMTQPAIAEAMGVSLSTVNRAHMAYGGDGLPALKSKPSGWPKAREHDPDAKRLIMLPPFAPAAETWARTAVESNICTKCAVSLIAARASKNASKVPDRLSRPATEKVAEANFARTDGFTLVLGHGRPKLHKFNNYRNAD